MVKYTPQYLKKLEEIMGENEYKVRYEKGNFKSGYCILETKKVVVINKFTPLESRINALVEIITSLGLSDKNQREDTLNFEANFDNVAQP
jgi:hypothetical protein